MYCIVLFINYLHHKRFQNESVSTLKSLGSDDADPLNTRLYFNPNCLLQLIWDYICTEAHINMDGDHYDMCNMDGELLNIKGHNCTTNGLLVFKQRETYAVVMIRKNSTNSQIEDIKPMLNPNSDVCEALVKKIKEKNPIRRRSSQSTKRSSASKYSYSYSQSSASSIVGSKSKRSSSAAL